MASLASDGGGKYRVLLTMPDRRRIAIRLGKVTPIQASEARANIEALAGGGERPDPAVRRWLASIPDALHARLAKAGLVASRPHQAAKLGAFIDAYIAERSDVKVSTRTVFTRFRRLMLLTFKPDTRLDSITPADVAAWRAGLARKGVYGGLAENTIRRTTGIGRQLFGTALRRGLIHANPFIGLPAAVRGNPKRQRFISRADIDKVIEAAPTAEWRLLIAMARYGGLRIPSETNALTWGDVLWDRNRIRIHASKTEHHQDGGVRYLPIFPELRGPLMEVFEAAEPRTVKVFRERNAENLRTGFERIIRKAGMEPWPKLFQNLRATRETELAAEHPLHVVTAWIGNSRAVALAHYLIVTEADFDRAAQKAARSGTESAGTGRKPSDENRVGAVLSGTEDTDTVCRMGDTGLEQPSKPQQTKGVTEARGAKSGARDTESPTKTAAAGDIVAAIRAAWPGLSAADKATVRGIVQGVN